MGTLSRDKIEVMDLYNKRKLVAAEGACFSGSFKKNQSSTI